MDANLPEWFLQLAHLGRDVGSPVSQLIGEGGDKHLLKASPRGWGGRGNHSGEFWVVDKGILDVTSNLCRPVLPDVPDLLI